MWVQPQVVNGQPSTDSCHFRHLPPSAFYSILLYTHFTSSAALLSFYVILSCSLALASILATLFHAFPNPTNVSMYLFTVFGMSYGIGAFWEYTLPGVKPPGEGSVRGVCMGVCLHILAS